MILGGPGRMKQSCLPAPKSGRFPVALGPAASCAPLVTPPRLLDVVRRLQAELNPQALCPLRLLRRLEVAARQVWALRAVVEENLGPRPDPSAAAIAAATASAGVFPTKLLGFRVCGLYLEPR